MITDVIDIALLGGTRFQDQYQSLRDKVPEWLADGALSPGFTVTGHSLGGFLVTGLAAEFPEDVAHAYLYHAPGLGGIADSILESYTGGLLSYVLDTISVDYPDTPDPALLSNIKADAGEGLLSGSSPIAMLGRQVSNPVWIQIEDQLRTDDPDKPSSRNHSQRILTDSLAVYDLLSRVDPSNTTHELLSLGTDILEATSNQAEASLEAVINGLSNIFNVGLNVTVGDREQLYNSIYAIREAIIDKESLQLISLVKLGADDIRARAAADIDEGLAYRYALVNLLPFTVMGDADLYDAQALSLDHFSNDYLADRARFLTLQSRLGIRDSDFERFSLEGNSQYIDLTTDTCPATSASHQDHEKGTDLFLI